MTKSRSTQARMPVLLNIRIFAARDDFFQPIPYLCLWGRMASCGRLEIGLVVDFSKASAGRLTIGRRLPTCSTFAAKPRWATIALKPARVESGDSRRRISCWVAGRDHPRRAAANVEQVG